MPLNNEKFVNIKNKNDLTSCFNTLFNSAWSLRSTSLAGILTGNEIPLYGEKIAALETFSRLMWGLFPALVDNNTQPEVCAEIFRTLAQGTDPEHPHYWGKATDVDQRCVEMAVFGVGLAIAGKTFRRYLSDSEQHNLYQWLSSIRDVQLPQNNWSFFPVMVEMGLCLSGQPWQPEIIERHFARLDSFYLGDGWYSDGLQRPRDYYNAMALHFYGLIYAQLMASVDPERCAILRQRAALFAADFIYYFDAEGAAIPFGRSMTYRFAQAAFWSAAAFAGLETCSPGVLKGLIFRHLRHWFQQDITDARGVLTVGYHYACPGMAEDYNAPGSPYWACKTFLILALPDEHPFWRSNELPLPPREARRLVPHPGQIVINDHHNQHHYLLNAGQFPAKPYNNSESKYGKFAYSSLLGFNLERSRYGIELAACDSMLLFAEGDGYFRGRLRNQHVEIGTSGILAHWAPWPDVQIKTWLIPLTSGHIRVHIIDTRRPLDSVEGGFPVPIVSLSEQVFDAQTGTSYSAEHGCFSRISDLSPLIQRESVQVISPPGSNIHFPCSSAVPALRQHLPVGQHILACLVLAGTSQPSGEIPLPLISLNDGHLLIKNGDIAHHIPLSYPDHPECQNEHC